MSTLTAWLDGNPENLRRTDQNGRTLLRYAVKNFSQDRAMQLSHGGIAMQEECQKRGKNLAVRGVCDQKKMPSSLQFLPARPAPRTGPGNEGESVMGRIPMGAAPFDPCIPGKKYRFLGQSLATQCCHSRLARNLLLVMGGSTLGPHLFHR